MIKYLLLSHFFQYLRMVLFNFNKASGDVSVPHHNMWDKKTRADLRGEILHCVIFQEQSKETSHETEHFLIISSSEARRKNQHLCLEICHLLHLALKISPF